MILKSIDRETVLIVTGHWRFSQLNWINGNHKSHIEELDRLEHKLIEYHGNQFSWLNVSGEVLGQMKRLTSVNASEQIFLMIYTYFRTCFCLEVQQWFSFQTLIDVQHHKLIIGCKASKILHFVEMIQLFWNFAAIIRRSVLPWPKM